VRNKETLCSQIFVFNGQSQEQISTNRDRDILADCDGNGRGHRFQRIRHQFEMEGFGSAKAIEKRESARGEVSIVLREKSEWLGQAEMERTSEVVLGGRRSGNRKKSLPPYFLPKIKKVAKRKIKN
jgi:hypothetical protein